MNFPPLVELLPHRPPMLLLRGIRSHGKGETVCTARFDGSDAALFDGDGEGVPSTLALELVAQAMAVHDGLLRRAENRPAASRGLLLGSRRFDLRARTLPVGEELRVMVTGEAAAGASGGLVRFDGQVKNSRGELLASGDVTVLEHRHGPA